MAKFAYNNAKNTSSNYSPFELYYGYHLRVLFKKNINLCLKSCFANKLAKKLRKLKKICY